MKYVSGVLELHSRRNSKTIMKATNSAIHSEQEAVSIKTDIIMEITQIQKG